jgi:hypothetical protein
MNMDPKKMKNRLGRRGMLGAMATAGGGLLLRSLATGIPASVLLDPLSAKAGPSLTAKTLILSVSNNGDPLNANVPGTYEDVVPGIFHPDSGLSPGMAPTELTLSGKQFLAAKPWADLVNDTTDQIAFFHHATYTPVHGELGRVQKMMDATEQNDMLISLIARETAPVLQTVQADPLSLGASGGELLSAGGRILGNVAPLSVRQALGGVEGPLKDLTALRDGDIDRVYDIYRKQGTPSQLGLLDAWVRSRDEVRGISQDLIGELGLINGNDALNQVRCAAVLAAMNIAPVITVHLPFGGDSHNDTDFEDEAAQTIASVGLLQSLYAQLRDFRKNGPLKQQVLIGSLNVFGRTLLKNGTDGRDHHSGHHVMMLMGDGIKGGVVGGLTMDASGDEYIAAGIDTASGGVGTDIPFEETLGAAGKTLAYALGVAEARVDEMIDNGKIIKSIIS